MAPPQQPQAAVAAEISSKISEGQQRKDEEIESSKTKNPFRTSNENLETASTTTGDPAAPAFHIGTATLANKGRRILRARRPTAVIEDEYKNNEGDAGADGMGEATKGKRIGETTANDEDSAKKEDEEGKEKHEDAEEEAYHYEDDDEGDEDYHEDEDDEYDSGCECFNCREELEAIGWEEDEDSYDDDDEEEFDNHRCDCPECRARRTMPSQVLMDIFRGINGGLHSDHDDDVVLEESDASDDDFNDDREGQQSCAVCFSSKNSLVQLPCCGRGARETDSSTRFCQKCIYKCLSKSGVYHGGCHIGECPRCRKLVAVEHRTAAPQCATVDQMCFYAEDNEANLMGVMLLVAYGEARHLPLELLENNAEKARRLVQWGLLMSQKEGQVFCMESSTQIELRAHIEREFVSDYSEHEEDNPLCHCSACTSRASTGSKLMIAVKHCEAAIRTLFKFKLLTSYRLVNRAIFVLLRTRHYLKADLEPWQEVVVALLNVYLVVLFTFLTMFAIAALIIAGLTLALAWVVIKTTGWAIDQHIFLVYTALVCSGFKAFIHVVL